MLRRLLGTGLLLATLAGCTKLEGKECAADSDCEGGAGRCDLSVGLCYQPGTEPETENCSPACAAYEACTTAGCMPRFTALTILSPANNAVLGGSPVQVQAQLVANPTYSATTTYPETLTFTPSRNDGGDIGTFGAVTRSGDTYTATWTPPSTQAQIVLTVAHPTPAAVKSASVTVQVDTVPPQFTISFSTPPARTRGTAGIQADEQDPEPEYDGAFRRDESVTVKISANEPVNNVALTVVGIGLGGTPGQAQPTITVQPGGTCDGSPPFCGTVTVDLSVPEMRAGRGTMQFQVAGQDAVGNPGTASVGLKVTRWRWAFDGIGEIFGSPAVGNLGTIYLGTSTNTGINTGKTFAIGPEGAKKWVVATGDVTANVAVGAFSSSEEYVYVAGRTGSGSFLYALRGSSGAEKHKCQYTNADQLQGSLAVGNVMVGLEAAETAAGIYEASGNQTRVAGIRPDAVVAKCLDTANSANPVPISVTGGGFVMKDGNVFYGTNGAAPGPQVTSYSLEGGVNTPRSGWPVTTPGLGRGLALLGDDLYIASSGSGASDGNISKRPVAGGALTPVYPPPSTSRIFNLAIDTGNVAYFGAESSLGTDLVSFALDSGTTAKTSATSVRVPPLVGKNNRLYTLDTQGGVTVWTVNPLERLWNLNLAKNLLAKDASLTIDCRRDAGSGAAVAGLGALYVPAGSRLYSFIVETPGLNPNAPWPKFQHDARNTGNPATPITSCP